MNSDLYQLRSDLYQLSSCQAAPGSPGLTRPLWNAATTSCAVPRADFHHRPADMALCRQRRDEEALGEVVVGQPVCDQRDHLALPVGERGKAVRCSGGASSGQRQVAGDQRPGGPGGGQCLASRDRQPTTLAAAGGSVLLVGLIFAGILGGVVSGGGDESGEFAGDPAGATLSGAMLAQLVIGVLGVLVISSEYATGLIRATMTACPSACRCCRARRPRTQPARCAGSRERRARPAGWSAHRG